MTEENLLALFAKHGIHEWKITEDMSKREVTIITKGPRPEALIKDIESQVVWNKIVWIEKKN